MVGPRAVLEYVCLLRRVPMVDTRSPSCLQLRSEPDSAIDIAIDAVEFPNPNTVGNLGLRDDDGSVPP